MNLREHVKKLAFLADASAKALTPQPLVVSGRSDFLQAFLHVHINIYVLKQERPDKDDFERIPLKGNVKVCIINFLRIHINCCNRVKKILYIHISSFNIYIVHTVSGCGTKMPARRRN